MPKQNQKFQLSSSTKDTFIEGEIPVKIDFIAFAESLDARGRLELIRSILSSTRSGEISEIRKEVNSSNWND